MDTLCILVVIGKNPNFARELTTASKRRLGSGTIWTAVLNVVVEMSRAAAPIAVEAR